MKIYLVLFLFLSQFSFALGSSIGTSSFPIVKFIPNPKINSLSGSSVSDAETPLFILNPASGKYYTKNFYFSLSYTKWIEDIYGISGLFHYKKYGLAFHYINEGTLTKINENGIIGDSVNNYNLQLICNYRKKFKKLVIGISGNLIINHFLDSTFFDLSLSAGGQYQINRNWGLGISLRHLGNFTSIPFSFDTGFSYSKTIKMIKIRFYSDFNLDSDNFPKIKTGLDYIYKNFINIRFGYIYKIAEEYQRNQGITFGVGLSMFQYQIDFSYIPVSGMQDSYQFSISSRISTPQKKKKKEKNTETFIPRRRLPRGPR